MPASVFPRAVSSGEDGKLHNGVIGIMGGKFIFFVMGALSCAHERLPYLRAWTCPTCDSPDGRGDFGGGRYLCVEKGD